jgi:hypothetical protein
LGSKMEVVLGRDEESGTSDALNSGREEKKEKK